MERTFWIGAATVFASMVMGVSGLQARIVLPHVLSDGMVLQRQTDVNIWGKASPDSKITVAPGWDGKRYTATVGTDSLQECTRAFGLQCLRTAAAAVPD